MKTAITRREFLARAAALGALCSVPIRTPAMQRLPVRPIPGTGETLPIVGYGSTKAVRQIPDIGTGSIERVIRTLLSYGGRVIDTGPRSEEIDAPFGELLSRPEFRDGLFVAAKLNTTGKEAGIAQFRQIQRLFQRRTLDLVQIQSLLDLDVHWPSLRQWQESGEARYIGATVDDEERYPALEAFMRRERPDFVQLNYSVMETLAESKLLPLAQDLGIAVLVNGPFMNGEYFRIVRGHDLPVWAGDFDCSSWAQFSLKYILANPAVTCVLTETTNPDHLEENIQAAFGTMPDEATRERMRRYAREL